MAIILKIGLFSNLFRFFFPPSFFPFPVFPTTILFPPLGKLAVIFFFWKYHLVTSLGVYPRLVGLPLRIPKSRYLYKRPILSEFAAYHLNRKLNGFRNVSHISQNLITPTWSDPKPRGPKTKLFANIAVRNTKRLVVKIFSR